MTSGIAGSQAASEDSSRSTPQTVDGGTPSGCGPAPASVCPIRNPELWRLNSAAEPLRQDRLALQRLIGRYGGEISLDQALARARIRMEGLSEEYQEMKRRGEAL